MDVQDEDDRPAVAFAGPKLIGEGPLSAVAIKAKAVLDGGEAGTIAIFDRRTSEPIDLDFRGTTQDIVARLTSGLAATPAKGRGRPKLGVTAREVTLLPRHWSWLSQQRGGASAALRRLIDEARKTHESADEIRRSRQSTYRFITAVAGDEPGYEEATRALFAGDAARFAAHTSGWPEDIRRHAERLAAPGLPAPAASDLPRPEPAGSGPNLGPDATWAPERCRAVITSALARAFACQTVESAERLTGGASTAELWRLKVGGEAFVLRLDPSRDGVHDPARSVACLRIAAEAGLAPPLVYADAAEGVSITAFIAATPTTPPMTRLERLQATVEAVARLHALSPFPHTLDYFDVLLGLLTGFANRGVLPADVLAGPLSACAVIAKAYPRDPTDLVSSHNDLNPGNVIFQGARPWILDWASAFAAPRYVDLAALATFQAVNETEARLILSHYLGTAPSPRQHARFFLMRQVSRLFYAAMLLSAADQVRPTRLSADQVLAHRLDAIRNQMAALLEYDGRVAFGCAFFNEAAQALEGSAWRTALDAA